METRLWAVVEGLPMRRFSHGCRLQVPKSAMLPGTTGEGLGGGAPYYGDMNTRPRTHRGPLHALQSFTVEAERYMEVTRRLAGLGHNDVHALSAIVEAGDEGVVITPGVLRRRLVLSPAATTALVDRLVGHGLIQRERMSSDGRTVALHATEKARRMGQEMFVVLSESIMERLSGYTPAELKRLIATMHDLTDAAREAREHLESSAATVNGDIPEALSLP